MWDLSATGQYLFAGDRWPLRRLWSLSPTELPASTSGIGDLPRDFRWLNVDLCRDLLSAGCGLS